MDKICEICKKEFTKKYNYSQNYWKKARFCSYKCRANYSKGKHHSKQHCQNIKNALKGKNKRENNGQWKGGRTRSTGGYILIKNSEHPFCNSQGYVFEHRLIMEKKIGRYLKKGEDVHHKNEIKDDNRIGNLQLLTHSEHMKISNNGHFKKGQLPYKICEKIITFCQQCKQKIFTHPSRFKLGRGKYCSKNCYYLSLHTFNNLSTPGTE